MVLAESRLSLITTDSCKLLHEGDARVDRCSEMEDELRIY